MSKILNTTRSLFIYLQPVPGAALHLYDKVGEEVQSYHDEALTVPNCTPVISDVFGELPKMWVNKRVHNILLIDQDRKRKMVYVGG